MKNHKYILLIIALFAFSACEKRISVDTQDVEASVVIDAWIDNRPATQTINITLSKNFNDESDFDRVSADAVLVEDMTDTNEDPYTFIESSPGVFEWIPATAEDSFGIVGHEYRLTVIIGDSEFQATSVLNPVPVIDSVQFNFQDESTFFDEYFEAEFFATDLEGFGNTYWIKGFKNGVFLDKPEYIATSYDGSFSASEEDGILFIPPLRTFINPFEDDEQGYEVGDVVTVELHSVIEEGFLYLNEIFTQTDRQGGISELFSVPVTNLTGNFDVVSGNQSVLGFFNTSSVSISELELTQELADEARADAN